MHLNSISRNLSGDCAAGGCRYFTILDGLLALLRSRQIHFRWIRWTLRTF